MNEAEKNLLECLSNIMESIREINRRLQLLELHRRINSSGSVSIDLYYYHKDRERKDV